MTTIVRDPLLRALQGEEDVLYTTEDGTVLAKFDCIKIEVSRSNSISLRFMRDYNLVADIPTFGPTQPWADGLPLGARRHRSSPHDLTRRDKHRDSVCVTEAA